MIGLLMSGILLAQEKSAAPPPVIPTEDVRAFDKITDQFKEMAGAFESKYGERQRKIQKEQEALNAEVQKEFGKKNEQLKAEYAALVAKTESKYCKPNYVMKEAHEGHNDFVCVLASPAPTTGK